MKISKSKNAFHHLAQLQQVSSQLLRADTASEIADIILDKGIEALGATNGEVVLLTANKDGFDVIAYRGYPQSIQKRLSQLPPNTPLLTHDVIASKKPHFFHNIEVLQTKYDFAKYFFQKTSTKSAALLPLHINGKAVGVLEFAFKTLQKFTPENKRFMLSLADQCAQAFDKVIALEEIKKSKDELEIIIRRIADGVIVRDAKGIIIHVNEAALQIHGLSKLSDLIGLSAQEYTNLLASITDDNNKPIPLIESTFLRILEGKNYANGTYRISYKTSKDFKWLNIKTVGIRNAKGELTLIVSVLQDITEQKQREFFKDEFMSIASHELKTPITSLKAFTQVLEKNFEKKGDLQSATLLAKMDMQISKLSNLVNDLLDVTKVEGGKLMMREEIFAFDEMVNEIIEEIQPTTTKKIIFTGATGESILADKDRIGQVLINLLTNAIKYSPESDEIVVTISKKDTMVTASVKDHGIGIPKSKQLHIFKRFYRETGFKENTFPGLGLGLYISSQIIQRHHGKIWVESEEGKGSTFYFSLPIHK